MAPRAPIPKENLHKQRQVVQNLVAQKEDPLSTVIHTLWMTVIMAMEAITTEETTVATVVTVAVTEVVATVVTVAVTEAVTEAVATDLPSIASKDSSS